MNIEREKYVNLLLSYECIVVHVLVSIWCACVCVCMYMTSFKSALARVYTFRETHILHGYELAETLMF